MSGRTLWPGTQVTRRATLSLGVAGLAGCTPMGRKAKTRLIIGAATGGGNDAFGQLFARRLQRLTGQEILVEFEARAGGVLVVDRLVKVPGDGAVIGMLPSKLIYEDQLGGGEAAADLMRLGLLGGLGADRRVLVVSARSAIPSFEALMRREAPTIIAASTLSSASYIEGLIINHLTGARLKPVPGYGGGARNLAVLSGEADGVIGDLASVKPLLDAGGRVILRLNDIIEPASAGAPSLAALARGPDRDPLVLLIAAVASLGRLFALPPAVPASLLADWRARLERVAADPGFRAEATAGGFNLECMRGPEVERTLSQLFDRNSPVIPALRRAMAAAKV